MVCLGGGTGAWSRRRGKGHIYNCVVRMQPPSDGRKDDTNPSRPVLRNTKGYELVFFLDQPSIKPSIISLLLKFPVKLTLQTLETDQAAANWRLGRRQVVLPAPLQRGLLHALLHHHHRHRLQDPHHRARRQARQAADLGHGGPGALPHHHHCLLPWCHGHFVGLRRYRPAVI